ncbi:carbamate kinase [Candidatus Fermentibacterales bacterium]|nr:carbamate kinase [Candidatus Fermentibacterales bacterium]
MGGNSLIDPASDRGNLDTHDLARAVCEEIATLAVEAGSVVVTHGNGPQVGFEMLRNETASALIPPDGMDVNVAATQGYIGYLIQQVLGDVLEERGLDIPVSSVITQIQVDPRDPGFSSPTKPVGPFYDAGEARRMMSDGWRMCEDAGRGWRRVVASPKPLKILELPVIRALVEAGQIVICAGGGGVPVVREGLRVRGVPAVIDKDHATALLAGSLGADTFIISTGVPEVYLHYGKPDQRTLRRARLAEMLEYLEQGHFASGSMRPKILASASFLENGGARVVITSPGLILSALAGEAGTTILAR